MRLYHPDLDTKPGYNPIDLPDDEGLFSVLKERGWSKTIPAEHTDPALAAEQPDLVYQPVSAAPKAEAVKPRRRGKAEASAAEATETD